MSFVEPYLSDLEDEVMIGETTRPVSSLKHFAKKVMQLISNKPKPIHVQFKELKAEALSLENASANGQNLSLSPSLNPNPNPTLLKQRESDESASQSKSIEEIKMVVIEENRETKKEKEEEEEEEKSQEVMGEEKENVKEEDEEEEGSEKDFAEQKDGQEDEKNDSKEEQEKQEEDEKQNEESEESEEQKEDEGEEKATNQVTVLNEGVDVEKVKKEFESTLTKQNRENLPHIQILKVFTTTPSPTTQLPTTQLPTSPSLPPTTPNLTVSTVSTSQSYPSPWKKGNNKFKGVRVRLFEGTQERAFSLFANRSPHQRPLFSRHFLRRHFDGGHHRFHLDVASALLSKPIGLTVFSIFPTSQSVGRGGFLSFLLVSDCASSFSTASKAKCRR